MRLWFIFAIVIQKGFYTQIYANELKTQQEKIKI